MLRLAADVTGARRCATAGAECDPRAEAERLTVADAFTHHAGIDLLATLSADGGATAMPCASRARRGGIDVADDDDWSDMFSKILVARIEPQAGDGAA